MGKKTKETKLVIESGTLDNKHFTAKYRIKASPAKVKEFNAQLKRNSDAALKKNEDDIKKLVARDNDESWNKLTSSGMNSLDKAIEKSPKTKGPKQQSLF